MKNSSENLAKNISREIASEISVIYSIYNDIKRFKNLNKPEVSKDICYKFINLIKDCIKETDKLIKE